MSELQNPTNTPPSSGHLLPSVTLSEPTLSRSRAPLRKPIARYQDSARTQAVVYLESGGKLKADGVQNPS